MRLTKTELRTQQLRLAQLEKYLPTLQLKKMLLQMEVSAAQAEMETIAAEYKVQKEVVTGYAALFSDRGAESLFPAVKVAQVKKHFENIAGLEIPVFEQVVFHESAHFLFDSPVWLDAACASLRALIVLRERSRIAEEKKTVLEKELREVSIRVNLFEKILIPRAQENIRKIRIFLADLQLAAVCQAKVAKKKLELRAV